MSSANHGSTLLHLDKSQNAAVSLAVLRRMDPDIEEIVAASNYCAVYQHDGGGWVRGLLPHPAGVGQARAAPALRPAPRRAAFSPSPSGPRYALRALARSRLPPLSPPRPSRARRCADQARH